MSLTQSLYQLDKSFSVKLDELLHNEKYVDGLLGLPEDELIKLVNYLSDVRFPPVKYYLANYFRRRLSIVSLTSVCHPESVCSCYGRYAGLEKFSPLPMTCLAPF